MQNFAQNKNICHHPLMGTNEVIWCLRSLIPLQFCLIWKGFFHWHVFYDNCTSMWVFNVVFLDNGGICHLKPWQVVTILCFYNWNPLHVWIHFVRFGSIFHDSNCLMKNCHVLDVFLYAICMMMWRLITWQIYKHFKGHDGIIFLLNIGAKLHFQILKFC